MLFPLVGTSMVRLGWGIGVPRLGRLAVAMAGGLCDGWTAKSIVMKILRAFCRGEGAELLILGISDRKTTTIMTTTMTMPVRSPLPSRRTVRSVLAGVFLATALATTLAAAPALAQDGPQERNQGQGAPSHEPPQSAFDDCKGKKPGERVQHATPGGKVTATCESSPQGLVARPDQPPVPPSAAGSNGIDGQNRPPPRQAFDDCKEKKPGERVEHTIPDKGTVPATCESSPDGLVARPDRPPPR
jgi:hypothetical protein